MPARQQFPVPESVPAAQPRRMDTGGPLRGNLFADLPPVTAGEVFETLLEQRNLLIERISSSATPPPVDYDQVQDEWVCLLRGAATLAIAGETVCLGPGDWHLIPAHTPHRVLATAPGSLWLAVHLYPGDGSPTAAGQ